MIELRVTRLRTPFPSPFADGREQLVWSEFVAGLERHPNN
jgi:hypothetical protein